LGRLLLRGLLLLDGFAAAERSSPAALHLLVADLVVDGDVASATLFACTAVEAALPVLFAGERLAAWLCLDSRGRWLCSR
jgi:hypothetical protein